MSSTPITPPLAGDSSLFGFVRPVSVNGELLDQNFRRFLQQLVVGITGLPGDMVRPRWEVEPANEPPVGTDWAAVGAVKFRPDLNAWEGHVAQGEDQGDPGADAVIYHEQVDVLISFYGPDVEKYAGLMVAGLKLPQNREYLTRAGYGLTLLDEVLVVPVLQNNRWVHGLDLPITIKRSVGYTYPIDSLTSAGFGLIVDVPPINRPILVGPGYNNGGYSEAPYGT